MSSELLVVLHFFEPAHALSGREELLYNIALCADRLQRTGEAMRLYEEYLTRAPEGEQHEAASSRLQAFYAARHEEEELRTRTAPSTPAISRCPEGYVRLEDACVLPPPVHQLGVGSIVGGSLLVAAGWSIQIGVTAIAGSGDWRQPDRQPAFNAWGYVPLVGSLVQLGYLRDPREAWPYTLGIGESLMQIVGIVMIIQGIMGEDVQPTRRARALRWMGDGVQIAF